jgi:predicted nuclease of predicted toxin-antitoxin system
MNLLADEGVDFPIVCALRALGHRVPWIAEESPGISDAEILNRAAAEEVLLLTGDKDFGELVWRHRLPHAGVLLLRLSGLSESEKIQLVCRIITERAPQLVGNFSVLTPRELRIRQAPA